MKKTATPKNKQNLKTEEAFCSLSLQSVRKMRVQADIACKIIVKTLQVLYRDNVSTIGENILKGILYQNYYAYIYATKFS